MHFEQFAALDAKQQKKAVQSLFAGPDHALFVAVREAFLQAPLNVAKLAQFSVERPRALVI